MFYEEMQDRLKDINRKWDCIEIKNEQEETAQRLAKGILEDVIVELRYMETQAEVTTEATKDMSREDLVKLVNYKNQTIRALRHQVYQLGKMFLDK